MARKLFLGLGVFALAAGTASAQQMAKMGPEDSTKQISVTVWLNLHNKATLDSMVEQMYDPNSRNYHHFLTMAEAKKQFLPTTEDVATVRSFLAQHGMTVLSQDKNDHFLVARGSVANAQKAFNTQVNKVMVKGVMHRMAASTPTVTGAASPLIASVQGLSDLSYHANVARAMDPDTQLPFAGVPLASVGANGLFFSANCFRAPQAKVFTTGGKQPVGTYVGNRYGADLTDKQGNPAEPPNLPPCGYQPSEMQKAYGLNPLYNKGLDGTGQTIVIVDAFGSNTLLDDVNLFNSVYGLPPLTSSNFAIAEPTGPATCTATNGCIDGNWQFETTLDVEWAHAMAPGANIVLVLGADNSFTNLDLCNFFAVQTQAGNIISNSFGIPEIVLSEFAPDELTVQNSISQLAAAFGISQQVSTGDAGDNLILNQEAFGIDSVSAGANSTSPYVTAVGGTSTFLDGKDNIKLQTGWGLNITRIADPTPNPPTIPPTVFGFQEGAGGGASFVFAKPAYQKALKGKFRQTPDISMNADPQTGVEIILTPTSVPGDDAFIFVIGGTSLSTPMFSGVWAIADQAAGASLGQAAPLLYKLGGNAIVDVNVQPIETILNVFGLITQPPKPPILESPDALVDPGTTKRYISALYNSPNSTAWDVIAFGTDSSLTTGPGWDNVTGLGTPNGAKFINAVLQAAR